MPVNKRTKEKKASNKSTTDLPDIKTNAQTTNAGSSMKKKGNKSL